MPAESEAQRRLMGMALAIKRGDHTGGSPAVQRVAHAMTEQQLKDFAKRTKHQPMRHEHG